MDKTETSLETTFLSKWSITPDLVAMTISVNVDDVEFAVDHGMFMIGEPAVIFSDFTIGFSARCCVFTKTCCSPARWP
jgi:hypothetical protein